MATELQALIHQSLQGDRDAFSQIVERYQSAVSAVTYSITGNLAQSEDLAQETFLIAWRRLGTLDSAAALAPWLRGIARNLARDWVRRQAKRPTVPLDDAGPHADPTTESPDARHARQEQADLVWSALAQLPEQYREPLVLFYRQGESVRAIAEVLDLSEDNVKQRLSRGRKMLRAEVEGLVETTLTGTRPGKAFTVGVLAALPALYGAQASAGEFAASKVPAVAATIPAGWFLKLALSAAVLILLAAAAVHWFPSESPAGNAAAVVEERAAAAPASTPEVLSAVSARQTSPASPAEDLIGAPPAPEGGGASVSGMVVYRDSGAPAPGMRVYLDPEVWVENRPVTGDDGRFSFTGISSGEHKLLAFDDRYLDVPETEYRSEFYDVILADEEARTDLILEVPHEGIVLSGKITDLNSGEPLEGVGVAAFLSGVTGFRVKSGRNGIYEVPGIVPGQWAVMPDSYGPIFHSGSAGSARMVEITGVPVPQVNFEFDRGLPLAGRVVDETGLPVAYVGVDATLFVGNGFERRRAGVRSGADGEFTLWGVQPGDRVEVNARKDDFSSPYIAETIAGGQIPAPLLLTLFPKFRVAGHFVDQDGLKTEALLWRRALHPDGPGAWHAQGRTAAATFDTAIAQGAFELRGAAQDEGPDLMGPGLALDAGPRSVTGLVVTVNVPSARGPYRVAGNVVDEAGMPLPHCTVHLGLVEWDPDFARTTKTSDNGHFEFNDLADGYYEAVATPREPFEGRTRGVRFSPEQTREITLVARRVPQLRGHVSDAKTGNTLSRFTVEWGVRSASGRETRRGPAMSNIIAESGGFTVPACLDLDWYLRVSAPGYAPQRVTGGPLAPGSESEVYAFNLTPSRAVEGTISGPEGTPVAGALVFIDNGDFRRDLARENDAIATSDDSGRFGIESLPEEAAHLVVWKAGFAVARVAIAPQLEVHLIDGGVIEGRVLVDGVPPVNLTYVIATSEETGDIQRAQVAEDGIYRLEDLLNAAYQLRAAFHADRTKGSYEFPDPVVAADGKAVTYEIDIPGGSAAVEGIVSDGGMALEHAMVKCSGAGGAFFAKLGLDGAYRFEDLPGGTATLEVLQLDTQAAPGGAFRPIYETNLDLKDGDLLQYDIELSQ